MLITAVSITIKTIATIAADCSHISLSIYRNILSYSRQCETSLKQILTELEMCELSLLGPFYGATAVPSVTRRCRRRRGCCEH